jgi:hypothetical protein
VLIIILKVEDILNIIAKVFVITYMYRYSCKTGYLIFPIDEENKEDFLKGRERIIADRDGQSKVIELGLKIPQNARSFSEFQNKMKESGMANSFQTI